MANFTPSLLQLALNYATINYLEFDGVSDELRVFLDDLLDFLLLEVLGHVLAHVQDYLGSTGNILVILVLDSTI